MKKIKVLFISVVVAISGTVVGAYSESNGLFNWLPGIDNSEESKTFLPIQYNVNMELFWNIWTMLDNDYLKSENLDVQNMTYGAVKGMVDSLDDPYTVFMDPTETNEFTQNLNGKLQGIGAELTIKDDEITVVTPIKNSPAERAGILPGDVIYKIGDEYTSDMTLFEAIMKIRGTAGTPVTLTIIRPSKKDSFDITIVRENIDIASVTKEDKGDGIVYIGINQFAENTAEEFGDAVSGLISNEPKGLILDLRYNGGGYLEAAVDILSYLLKEDLVAVNIKQRDENSSEEMTTGKVGEKMLDVPLVVLVNDGSASASEIVAGALQDYKRGVLMGTQTFGKGTVQSVEYLDDGSSLRMTIAQWFTPEGRAIDKVGITPDLIIENPEDQAPGSDKQLQEAINYLKKL